MLQCLFKVLHASAAGVLGTPFWFVAQALQLCVVTPLYSVAIAGSGKPSSDSNRFSKESHY